MALTDSLVAYWRLDESSGNATDSSGNSRTLTAIGAPGSRAGKLGNARDFVPGSSQRFEIAAASLGSVFVGTASWTMAGWILPDDAATFREIAGQFSGSLRGPMIRFEGTGASVRVQWLNDATANFQVGSVATLSAGAWYFIAATYDIADSKLRFRLNATTTTSSALTGTFSASTVPFALGQRSGTGGSFGAYWDGGIDDFGVWSRALTSAELDQLYNSGAGLDPTASTQSIVPHLAAHTDWWHG